LGYTIVISNPELLFLDEGWGPRMRLWRHVKAFFLLTFLGFFVVPALILVFVSGINIGWSLEYPVNHVASTSGLVLIILGLYLVVRPTLLFATHGEGTVAHWDPTTRLVVQGPYRYVRNPIVLGVVITMLGEGVLFGAFSLIILAIGTMVANHIAFVKSEEPTLIKRFGDDYRTYMENVPRWIPRLRPWKGATSDTNDGGRQGEGL
jgi:protein-S-isoprenylcysteine O-methyltransferase Ste14